MVNYLYGRSQQRMVHRSGPLGSLHRYHHWLCDGLFGPDDNITREQIAVML